MTAEALRSVLSALARCLAPMASSDSSLVFMSSHPLVFLSFLCVLLFWHAWLFVSDAERSSNVRGGSAPGSAELSHEEKVDAFNKLWDGLISRVYPGMCGREYQDFRHYACLEGIPHEDDPDYDWKFQIYRAGMNAVRDKARVPSSPGPSESGFDDDYISSEKNHESLAHNGDFHYPNNMLFVSPPTCPFSHHFFVTLRFISISFLEGPQPILGEQ